MTNINNFELDFGIQLIRDELNDLKYMWNRQQDFNEWFDDVYQYTNFTTKELWEQFEKHEDKLLAIKEYGKDK